MAKARATIDHWQAIRDRDWLDHPWQLSIRKQVNGPQISVHVVADGVNVLLLPSRQEAERWIATRRVMCLIARRRELHPMAVHIDAKGHKLLARIKPELWGSFDAIEVMATPGAVTALPAKARASSRTRKPCLCGSLVDQHIRLTKRGCPPSMA